VAAAVLETSQEEQELMEEAMEVMGQAPPERLEPQTEAVVAVALTVATRELEATAALAS
jgi:hypothetical protein